MVHPTSPQTLRRPRRSLLASALTAVLSAGGLSACAVDQPVPEPQPLARSVSPAATSPAATRAPKAPSPSRTASAKPTGSGREKHDPARYDKGGMDPAFQATITRATAAAKRDGVRLSITSGYRTYAAQETLYRKKIKETGSVAIASQTVMPPWKSMHVRGKAVDVNRAGARWLTSHGTDFGLCQRYANEWWHFEKLTTAGGRCPKKEPNASGS